jgi:pyruvate/2-oxoglutarate dehydrogenase complex dihydrolipoamide acyltransferase (E2) component
MTAPTGSTGAASGTRARVTPRARRLAAELGVDLAAIDVSSPVTSARVRAASDLGPTPTAAPPPARLSAVQPPPGPPGPGVAGSALVTVDCGAWAVGLVADAELAGRVVEAATAALADHPMLHARVDPDGRLRPGVPAAHLVGRDARADGLGVYAVGSAIGVVALPPLDVGELASLGFGSVSPQPVAVPLADGSFGVGIRPQGLLCLTWDRRRLGSTEPAAFLAAVKSRLERRASASPATR